MADKAKLTDDMELAPGVVVTPGYPAPERAAAAGGFGDRRIIVHEDGAAVAAERAKFFTAEVADHPISSTYAPRGASPAAEKK